MTFFILFLFLYFLPAINGYGNNLKAKLFYIKKFKRYGNLLILQKLNFKNLIKLQELEQIKTSKIFLISVSYLKFMLIYWIFDFPVRQLFARNNKEPIELSQFTNCLSIFMTHFHIYNYSVHEGIKLSRGHYKHMRGHHSQALCRSSLSHPPCLEISGSARIEAELH